MKLRAVGNDSLSIPEVIETLEATYGRPKILPVFDPIEELVSCILSQHTSDRTSYPVFTRLRRELPDWRLVIEAGPVRVAEIIRGAGLANSKSKSICACLAEIDARNGAITLEPLRNLSLLEGRMWLTSLPGVGPKTASIVLCFSFGLGAIPVDTHVFRVAWRLGIIEKDLGEAKAHDTLLEIVQAELAGRFHLALLAHGRAICRAPTPKCSLCPLKSLCAWYRENKPST